jgi:hypothetical protein
VSSPKPDLHDLAARFARKAESDEIALDKLGDDPDVPDDLIGFHAQQALEKLLKAALAHAGVAPPRIHNLGKLLSLLLDAGMSPPVSVDEARVMVPGLSSFATTMCSTNASTAPQPVGSSSRCGRGSTNC